MATLLRRIVDGFRHVFRANGYDIEADFECRLQAAIAEQRREAARSTAPTKHVLAELNEVAEGIYCLTYYAEALGHLTSDHSLTLIGQIAERTLGGLGPIQQEQYLAQCRRILDPSSGGPAFRYLTLRDEHNRAAPENSREELIEPFSRVGRFPHRSQATPGGDILLHYASTTQQPAERVRLRSVHLEWRVQPTPLDGSVRVPYHNNRLVPGWEEEERLALAARMRLTAAAENSSPDKPMVAAPVGRAVRRMFPDGAGNGDSE